MQCRSHLSIIVYVTVFGADCGAEHRPEVLGYNTGDHAPGYTDAGECAPYIAGLIALQSIG